MHDLVNLTIYDIFGYILDVLSEYKTWIWPIIGLVLILWKFNIFSNLRVWWAEKRWAIRHANILPNYEDPTVLDDIKRERSLYIQKLDAGSREILKQEAEEKKKLEIEKKFRQEERKDNEDSSWQSDGFGGKRYRVQKKRPGGG